MHNDRSLGPLMVALFVVLVLMISVSPAAKAEVTVTLTAPVDSAQFAPPANISLTASASAGQGYGISKVEFFSGTTLIGGDTSAPYSITWNNVPKGTYSLTAKATAVKNNSPDQIATSSPANIVVNAPPVLSLTNPLDGAHFNGMPASVAVSATASDSDGVIASVRFKYEELSENDFGEAFVNAPPYNTILSLSTLCCVDENGNYRYWIRATAIDNDGGTTNPQYVSVTVANNWRPTVSVVDPAANATFNAPATIALSANAADSDGTITQVEFFANGASVGTDATAPYNIQWTNVAAGSYSLTAVATDNGGASTTSAAVPILVSAPPTVSLTSPANNASFTAPANITLTADAADADGTVTSVEFYHGTTLITTLGTAPYTFAWTNVPQGTYALTAKATDDRGATTTSAPVNITVGAAVAQLYFIHADHLNTPRLIADVAGTTVWRWDQAEPFANNPADENPDGNAFTFDLPLRLPGQYFDKETNLAYNYFRDYDPAIGRYVQSDPIGLASGINLYAYVRSIPLGFVDPLGLVEYLYLDVVEGHLRWLAGTQGDNFSTSRFWAAEREMLNRLKRGEETPWDLGFYHHEKAEADMCKPLRGLPPDEVLKRQKEIHQSVLATQQNNERDLYHPSVILKYPDLFPKDWRPR